MTKEARAGLLPNGRPGQAITAGMWNQHVAEINRLADGARPPLARVQQSPDAGAGLVLRLISWTTSPVDLTILNSAGTPTGDAVRADLITTRLYQVVDGSVLGIDDEGAAPDTGASAGPAPGASSALAARVPTGREGDPITVGMWNQHVATINRLADGAGPTLARVQQGAEPGTATAWELISWETEQITLPVLDAAGDPTGETVKAELVTRRTYQAAGGVLVTFDDAMLAEDPP